MRKVFAGPRLRRLRQEHSLKQVELARDLGIATGYRSDMEHNQRPVRVPILLRITKLSGVAPTFFAASDTSRLIAELREPLTDLPTGEQWSTDERDELASAMPSVYRVQGH